MRSIQRCSILFLIALATTVGLAQSEQTRSVVMDLNLPNGATPRLRIADGGVGSAEIPDVGKFGFVPRIQTDRNTIVIEVLDLKTTPHKRLARVEAAVGGEMVRTDSTPQFGIRVVRIATP
jgi:hypothetical protein